jgi:YbgC/YbaW family acyl-CoA thioester hydrolase
VHLNYFEQARFEMLARCGFTYAEIARRGWAIHVVRVEVDYRREVLLQDRLKIRSWVEGFRRTSMTLRQEALCEPRGPDDAPQVAALARVVAIWIGDGGRPMRVPEEVREALSEIEAP